MQFTAMEKALLLASIDTYSHQMREACLEDQGVEEGMPGTIGYEVQRDLTRLRNRIYIEVRGY